MLPRNEHTRALAAMVASSAGFSFMAAMVNVATKAGVTASQATFGRFLAGLGAMCAALALRPQYRQRVREPLWLILRGVVGSLAVLAWFATIEPLGLAKASLIAYTYPAFAAILAWPILGERVTPRLWAALAVAVAGAALLSFQRGRPAASLSNAQEALWSIAAAMGAAASGFAVCAVRRCRRFENSFTIYGSQCAFGLLIAVAGMAIETRPEGASVVPSGAFAWALLAAIALSALAAQLLMTQAYGVLPATEGSLLSLLTPCLNLAAGLLFFGESIGWAGALGALMILSSCVFVSFRRPKPPRIRTV